MERKKSILNGYTNLGKAVVISVSILLLVIVGVIILVLAKVII